MANQITGKVIAISDKQTIQGKDASKQPVVKRQLFLDCTRYDPYTGERGYENTPLLEFSNKALEKLETLIEQGLKKDDVVTVFFDIQGKQYTDKTGKKQVFTSVRPYDIEKRQMQQQAPAEPPHQAPVDSPQQAEASDLPF